MEEPRIVMGVDPGLASTGVGVISRKTDGGWSAVWSAHVKTPPRAAMPDRLARIHSLVAGAIGRFSPEIVAVESIFFAKNVRSAVLMAHGRGAAILAAAQSGATIREYSPLEIKQSVVGKGRAGKEQVKRMVGVLLGLSSVPSSDHETDALACALCHAFRAERSWSTGPRLAAGEGHTAPQAPDNDDPRRALLALSYRRKRRRRR